MIHLNRIIRFLCILLTVICSMTAFAGVEPYQNQLKGTINQGDILLLKDDKFENPLFDWNKITNHTVKNFISLEITNDHQIVLNTAFTVEVDLKVEYYSTPGQAAPVEDNNVKLKINFDPQAGVTYKAKDVYSFSNGYRVKVTVNSINSPELGANIPAVLQLTSQVVIDRQYTFEPDVTNVNFTTGDFSEHTTGTANTTPQTNFPNGYFLNLGWDYVQGAEEYDVEWAVFDKGTEKQAVLEQVMNNQNVSQGVLDDLFRNNATRITTDGQHYDITMVYNADYIMVRIRQVHYTDGIRQEDDWDYKKGSVYAFWEIPNLHQESLNWQYSATFAEEGKKKEIVSYFDGSLRSRQMVTINNSDKVAVVQENVYDEFGRAAANILPAPTDENKFHFYANFNRNAGNTPYNYNDLYGTQGVNCERFPAPLGEGDGAAKYYSPNNSFLTKSPGDPLYRKFNSYIPKAEGYPMSVTQFTNDNTGRVRIQGGVGRIFQPGWDDLSETDPSKKVTHVTKYYYGKPESWELDRLFGNDVGYANHYQKNMVIDPNGQISISYVNASGKTIATALTGKQPKGMDALPSKPEPKPETFTILRPQQFVFDATALSIKAKTTYLASVAQASATFDYDIQKLIYTYQGPAFQVCSNCYYDLTIRITNDCGQPIYSTGPNPIQVGTKTGDCNYVGTPYAPFTVTFDKIGEYYITFELKLSKDVINTYADSYIAQREANNDLKKEIDFVLDYLRNTNFDGCFNECTTCEAALGSEAQFTQAVIGKLTDYQVNTNSAALNTFISDLYNRLHTQCLALRAGCMVSSCSRYEQQMLDDVSPGGQYALFGYEPFAVIEQELNVIANNWRNEGLFSVKDPSDPIYQSEAFTDENGNLTSPYDVNFTLEMLIKYWKPEWAAKFLQFHPEKCKLDFCNANSNYFMWDDQVQQFINKATDIPNIPGTSGLAYSYTNGAWLLAQDPFFQNGAPGASYKSQFEADLNSFSSNIMKVNAAGANVKGLTAVIDYLLYCADLDGSTNSGPAGDSWNNCTPVPSCRVPDREWDQYKEIYFQLKQKYYQLIRSGTTCAGSCQVGEPYSFGACPTINDFAIEKVIGSNACNPGTQPVRITYKRGVAARALPITIYYPSEYASAPVKPTSVVLAAGQSEKIICVSDNIDVSTIKVSAVNCDSAVLPTYCNGISGSLTLPNNVQQINTNTFQHISASGVLTTYTFMSGRADAPPDNSTFCPDGTVTYKNFFNCFKFFANNTGVAYQFSNVWLLACEKDVCANAPLYAVDQQLDTYRFYKDGLIYYIKLSSGGATPPCAYTPNYQPCLKVQVGNNAPLIFTNASVHTCEACPYESTPEIAVRTSTGIDPISYLGIADEIIYVYPNTWDGYTPPSMPCANEPVFYQCVRFRGHATNDTYYNASVVTCPQNNDPCANALDLYATAARASDSYYYNGGYYTIYPNADPALPPQTDCHTGDVFFHECVKVHIGVNTITYQNAWVLDCISFNAQAMAPMAISMCWDAYKYKKSRFPEIQYSSNFTMQNMIDMQNENNILITDQVAANCEAQADKWMSQLQECLLLYPNKQTELRNALVDVCKNGGDVDHPFGSSTVRPIYNGSGYTSFKQAIQSVLDISTLTMTCNPWLLDEPHPYEPKQQSASITLAKTNASLCTRLQELITQAGGADLFNFLTNMYGSAMNLTRDQLNMLVKSCNNCRYLLEDNIPLPVFMEPGTVGCITKTEYDAAKAALEAELGSNFDASHVNYPDMLANYLNHRWGFSMAYFRYEEYEALLQSNQSAILCNNVPYTEVEVDPYVCLKSLVEAAIINGRRDYLAYIEEEKRLFRLSYISTCSQVRASAKLTTDQQTYHYTLYYYDQAGNLIRTVSPEGVRFLSDEEMALVDEYRKMDDMIDCASVSANASADKTFVLNTFSSEMGNTKSLEMWINGNTDSRQVRFVTPDNKYMYQAAIKDSKLWVELYTLAPGANGTIDITLTNHATAELSSAGIAEWSHLVVQANDFASDPWTVYLNNKQLTLLPDASAPAYPFGWEIEAGFTVPAEETSQLRHLRLYNKLINAGEIAANYVNPCRVPEGALNVKPAPLIVWGGFYPGACTTTVETELVNNGGALQVNGDLAQSGKWFPAITNNFTIEFWVNPQGVRQWQAESNATNNINGLYGQQYVITPEWGGVAGLNRAGMGVSVGTNGVSVYEHADNYMPPMLVWEAPAPLTGWHHVAIVYNNKQPQLYVDGVWKHNGLTSQKAQVIPSYNLCSGNVGVMRGGLDELRIWNTVRTAAEISSNYNQSVCGSSSGLVAYWPISNSDGSSLKDIAPSNLPVAFTNNNYSYTAGTSNVKDLAAKKVMPGVFPRHRLATSYAFNSSNGVVQQKSPDGGHSYFWYDMLSRLVASQNEEQRTPHDNVNPNRYSYTKYEPTLGRITEVGEKSNVVITEAPGYLTIQQVNDFLNFGVNTQITSTVYDRLPTGLGVATGLLQENLRKRVSASLYRETDAGLVSQGTYYSYDIMGNAKSLWQQIEGLGLKRIDYEYDLVSGKTNFVRYQHGLNDQFYYAYEYDAENRLIEAQTGTVAIVSDRGSTLLNGQSDAFYRYFLHGPIARTELGQNKVQGIDYAYTIQGWLKGINGNKLNASTEIGNDGLTVNDPARDVMAFTLGYFNYINQNNSNYDYEPISGATAGALAMQYSSGTGDISGNNLFNGNISHTSVALSKFHNGAPVGYTYRYDQLNRLKAMHYHPLSASITSWDINSKDAQNTYGENITYDGNGNIKTYFRNGANSGNMPLAMDNLSYNYKKEIDAVNNQEYLVHNQLQQVKDDENISGNYSQTSNGIEDIDNQTRSDNYTYDKIGNLVSDEAEFIKKVKWTVYGKIKSVEKVTPDKTTLISYAYDAAGNRIKKAVTVNAQTTTTWYFRDAQGNSMAVYSDNQDNQSGIWWKEQHLYGGSRLGVWNPAINSASTSSTSEWGISGKKQYELTNHLGNVLATITDKIIGVPSTTNSTLVNHFEADVVSAQDYYPFGMLQPGRNYNVGDYRYGFNGKENDNEVKGGLGNQQDYGMRIYDPRVGRFLSEDPLSKKYPELTPYQFASNRPIDGIDLDGKEWSKTEDKDANGVTIVKFEIKLKVVDKEFCADQAKLNQIASSAGTYLKTAFNNASDDGTKYEFNITFTKVDQLNENDYGLNIDNVAASKGGFYGLAVGQPSTQRGVIVLGTSPVKSYKMTIPGGAKKEVFKELEPYSIADIGFTLAHELLHKANLMHPWLETIKDIAQNLNNQRNSAVSDETVRNNIMNTAQQPDKNLQPERSKNTQATAGQVKYVKGRVEMEQKTNSNNANNK